MLLTEAWVGVGNGGDYLETNAMLADVGRAPCNPAPPLTYGCSLPHYTYGCSLPDTRLQPPPLT